MRSVPILGLVLSALIALPLLAAGPGGPRRRRRRARPPRPKRSTTPPSIKQLKVRNIGPANMGGRTVDFAVPETNARSSTPRSGRAGCGSPRTPGSTGRPPSTRKRRSRSARWPSRRATPISSGSARARPRPGIPWPPATASTSPRTPARPGRTWAWPRPVSSAASSSTRPIPTSSTSPPRATSGARTRSAASTGRPTAARPGRRSSTSIPRPGACDMAIDPSNSKILYAGMWEYRRWPYYFRSGGPGSGIYRTTDGGETWAATAEGLPAGPTAASGSASPAPIRTSSTPWSRRRTAGCSAPRTRAAPGAGPATRRPTTGSTSGRSTTAA